MLLAELFTYIIMYCTARCKMKRSIECLKRSGNSCSNWERLQRHATQLSRLTMMVKSEADNQNVFLNMTKSLPQALRPPEVSNLAYNVHVATSFVYKMTNCSDLARVKGLIKEYRVSQTLRRVYSKKKYDLSDLNTPITNKIHLVSFVCDKLKRKRLLLYLVLHKVGCSVREWCRAERPQEERQAVIKQIEGIHQRFISIKFFHGDLKPSNFLISNVSQGNGPKVSICDFGLSGFPTSRKEYGRRGTPLFKAKSFFLRCDDWRKASSFQLAMTSIFILVGDSVRKAFTCSRSKCSELHDLEDVLKKKRKLSTSFLQLLQDFKIRRRPANSCQTANREGTNIAVNLPLRCLV
jgi:serine/threonine protein kinase